MDYSTITDAKLQFGDFGDNSSGLIENAYIIPISWLATEQKPTTGTTAASLVEIAGDHIMATGKSPILIQLKHEKSGAKSESQGEMLSKSFAPSLKAFMPELSSQNLGTASMIRNVRCLVLFKRADGGDFYQMGTSELPVYVNSLGTDLGEGPTGAPGITLELKASASKVPFYVYKGALPVTGV